jgi:hypothetical protein
MYDSLFDFQDPNLHYAIMSLKTNSYAESTSRLQLHCTRQLLKLIFGHPMFLCSNDFL